MIRELATIHSLPGEGDNLAASLPRALAVIAADEGCLAAEALRCVERPDEFVLIIDWESIGGHEAFRASERFASYRQELSEYLGAVVGFAHYRPAVETEAMR